MSEQFTRGDVVSLLLEVMDWTYVKAHRETPMSEAEKKVLDEVRAALAEPEKERAEVAAPARGEIEVSTGKSYREHVTDGSPCWCNPELNYRDPETGAEVWVHRREQ